MIVAARQFVAWALVLALAVSTPVIGWCATADHQGQTLHPLFEHVHQVRVDADHGIANHEHAHEAHADPSADHATSWSATAWSATAPLGSAGWMAGTQVIPPSVVRLVTPELGSSVTVDVLRPSEHRPGPLFPPPRLPD